MPVISPPKAFLAQVLTVCACAGAVLLEPGCAAFGAGGPTLVAQGKYYSSGNPEYDAFFIELYQLQLQMADAPRVPEAERQTLASALGLAAETTADAVAARLREEALKLAHSGIHLRLEQSASADKPESASAMLRATYRPKDDASASFIATVETSSTNLLRSASIMKASQVRLAKLDVDTINLDAGVPKAFAEARVGKRGEVKKNLADAQKLITLMKARGEDVRAQSEQLLAAIATAVNTDDGSLSTPPVEPVPAEPKSGADSKKSAAKSRLKNKAAGSAPVPSAPTPAAKPKPNPSKAAASDEEAAPKPAAALKPAPPPRDFEP